MTLLLLAWSLGYPRTEMALLALAMAGFVAVLGGYRAALVRRRALLRAALVPDTWLCRILTGRIHAVLSGLLPVIVVLPGVAYFTLIADRIGWLLLVGLGVFTTVAHLAVVARSRHYLTLAFRPAFSAPLVALLAAILFGGLHAWTTYSHTSLPYWIDEPSLPAMVDAAVAELPHLGSLATEVLSVFRGAEALASWIMKTDGFRSTSVIVYILGYNALVFIGLARLFTDAQVLALDATVHRQRKEAP
jgi:hypothetical protein